MARAIDADAFEKFLMNLPDEVLCEDCCYVVVNEMRNQPTIDPVKHGKWEEGSTSIRTKCSNCKKEYFNTTILEIRKSNYCPNCGARMDGE